MIDSDNGFSPGRRQAIICTNAGILLIGPLGTNFSEMLIKLYVFSLKKMQLKFGWDYGQILPYLQNCSTFPDTVLYQYFRDIE